ncbi:MAG TPA: aldolase/citrate lyase family protein, partial [Mycobacterium sp.]
MRNRTKEKLRRGEAVLGTFIFLGDPAIVEIASIAGLDFVVIDTEHAARDITQVESIVRAADARGITPLVRVSSLDDKEILRALETGAQGIMVPQVESAEQVRQMLSAMRYPPHGTR